MVGVGVIPFVGLSIINHGWQDCTDLCLFVGYTSSVYLTASVLTLAAIALDRYHSILHCLHYNSHCTLWRICAVVLWVWLQALATSWPPLLGWSSFSYVVPMYNCAVNWARSPSYTIFMAALSYLTPAVVILFCYVNIVKVARSHARRIHTLEDSVQRSRNSSQHHCRSSPWRLIYHINAQSSSQPPSQNSQQHHHGVMRLFLIISAFLLCWTPYLCVALVQAIETAISGQSTLVPPFAITTSYWLVLLNSDINPLLYALLSKRFQSALRGLGQKIRSCLGSVMGRRGEVRAEGDEVRNSDPCTMSTAHPSSQSSTESLTCENSKYSSSIFTVSAGFKHHSEEHICRVCHRDNTRSTSSGEAGGDRKHNLQVPSRPQERSRLPLSALTEEREATFLFGQITVRVEHDAG
ncbi:G-protein coupled receptor 161 isoform X2 [Melanotaenia boesemani]|nr:G-protein coupled receptor 161 isoform X2 [Melanotaenia boesemani]